ncbi:MAG TPA: hypothetical protein VLG74_03335 [Blastocatellia bacterium]|nr:hypothetical protein [Blastocatellia bacterium]
MKEVLWWLPEDTEAVSVVRGPFKAAVPLLEPPENMTAIEYVDLALQHSSLGVLQTIKRGQFYEPLVGRSVLFCVDGSRRFRPPTSLGGMLYEGCHIIVFQRGLGPPRDSLIRRMASSAKRVQSIAGQQVMTFEERLDEDTWEILVAFPAPEVLLCATNQTFLTQVLNRMLVSLDESAEAGMLLFVFFWLFGHGLYL